MRNFIPLLVFVLFTISPARADVPEPIVAAEEAPAEADYTFDGAALYATHCARCHSELAKTRIPDRRPGRIASAIRTLGVMNHLKSLSALEVIAISRALTSENPSPSGP